MTDAAPRPDPVSAIALLDEPTRRRLYDLVAASPEPVGRDQAAQSLDISRELAAFHLDRLVAGGLLETEYRRLGERRGPGAGRPAKLYRRAPGEVAVSLPARDYRRAAEILETAIASIDDAGVATAIEQAAHAHGQATGSAARASARLGTPRDTAAGARCARRAAGRGWLRAGRRRRDGRDPAAELPVPRPGPAEPRDHLRHEPRLGGRRRRGARRDRGRSRARAGAGILLRRVRGSGGRPRTSG